MGIFSNANKKYLFLMILERESEYGGLLMNIDN